MLKEIKTTTDGTLFRKTVIEVPNEPSRNPKEFARLKIQNEVFDEKDSLADTTKWLSLLTTLVSEMYAVLDDSAKAKLDPSKKDLIEYTFAKFKATKTRGDVQFEQEGMALVDKLLERQSKIGEIIK